VCTLTEFVGLIQWFGTRFALLAVVCSVSMASTPPPFSGECQALDAVYRSALLPSMSSVALRILEAVAEKRPDIFFEPATTDRFHFFSSRYLNFEDSVVRVCALERIGATGSPAAIQYLDALTPNQITSDPSRTVFPSGKIALKKALLKMEPDLPGQTAFLVRQLEFPSSGTANGRVADWAIEEMCNRGHISSFALVQRVMKKKNSFASGESELQFCLARMRVVISSPNRTEALVSALSTDPSNDDNERLVYWAIHQLAAANSAEADAGLDKYTADIERRAAEKPGDRVLRQIASEARAVKRNPR
jgi:hypothetical protein